MKQQKVSKKLSSTLVVLILLMTLVFPVQAGLGTWSSIGSFATDPDTLAQFDDNGTLYVVSSEYTTEDYANHLTVKKFAAGSWSTVGPERFTDAVSTGAFDPAIFVDQGVPYVAYIDTTNYISNVTVMKYAGGSWQLVGPQQIILDPVHPDNQFANKVSLYVDDGTPYIAMVDTTYIGTSASNKVSVMKYAGGSWQFVGERRFSDLYVPESAMPEIFVDQGVPYVTYCVKDGFDYFLRVKKFTGAAWTDVGDLSGISLNDPDQPMIQVNNDIVYVSCNEDGYARVLKYASDSWAILGNNVLNPGYADNVVMTLCRGEPYVAFEDTFGESGNYNYVTVARLNASGAWEAVGSSASPYAVSSNERTLSLVADDNTLFLACQTNYYSNQSGTVYAYGLPPLATVNIQVSQSIGGSYTYGATTYSDLLKTFSVQTGSGIDLTFTATAGNIISSVYVDSSLVATKPGTQWTYEASNLTAGHTVAVTYAPGYQVTMAIPDGHGTFTGSGFNATTQSGYYLNSESTSLTAAADTGYALTYWWATDTPGTVSAVNPIPVDSASEHAFTARFDPFFTYTASAGSGGSITPTATVYATWDSPATTLYYPAKTFTISPDTGFHIENVWVDDVAQGAIPSYTFASSPIASPPGNHTIVASFTADEEPVGEPEEAIDDLLTFFADEISDGNLTGTSPNGKNGDNRLNAFQNMLKSAQQLIDAGEYEEALLQLQSAYAKVDGQPNPPDFIEGPARQELADKILALIAMLEDLI